MPKGAKKEGVGAIAGARFQAVQLAWPAGRPVTGAPRCRLAD